MTHVMQEQIDACYAIMIFGIHGWLFKSFSLIKSWVQNWVSTQVEWIFFGKFDEENWFQWEMD